MARRRRGGRGPNEFGGLSRSARKAGHGGAAGKGRGWKKGIEDPRLRAAIADVVRKAMSKFSKQVRDTARAEVRKAGAQLKGELKREFAAAGIKGDGFSVAGGLVGGGARATERAAAAISPSNRTAGRVVARAAIDVAEGAATENLLKHTVATIGGRAGHAVGAAALGSVGGPLGIIVAAAIPILVEQLSPKFGEFLAEKLKTTEEKLRADLVLELEQKIAAALLDVDFEGQKSRSTKFEDEQAERAFQRVLEEENRGTLSHRDGAIVEAGN